MIREAIILAGGLGTRLRSAVPDLPKCMAPVAERPFIWFLMRYLKKQGIESFIFSLGYKNELIKEYLEKTFPGTMFTFVIEDEPLGTGGAIKLACDVALEPDVIIFNGDTLFETDIQKIAAFHLQHHATCTLSLKPMHDFDRYGVVEINKENYIQSFKEKKYYKSALINGGVYALNVAQFAELSLPEKFSFEKDFLEKYFASHTMMGLIQDQYFIDIGIPEDLEKANHEFPKRFSL